MTHTRVPQGPSPFAVAEDGPFLVALNTAVLVAKDVQDLLHDLHRLNEHERLFVCVDTFLTEAQAGGVGHFFWGECAALYDQVLLGLNEIGAQDVRDRLERYVSRVFGSELPKTAESRQSALQEMDEDEDHQAEHMVGPLAPCASQLAKWARAHRQHFSPQ